VCKMVYRNFFNDLVIFEMANNHQGNLELGKTIISAYAKLAQKYNLNVGIKLQYRNLPHFIHPVYRNRMDVKYVDRFLDTMLPNEAFHEMVNLIKEYGLLAICTPFDEASVDLCSEHEIDIIKVASCSALDWPLHEKIVQQTKPVIISTAGLQISDIDKIYNFYSHKKLLFALLHCTAIYPALDEQLQMNFIDRLRYRYSDVAIGYSGHEAPDNINVVKIAVAKGVKILERHIGIPTEEGKLNGYSMNLEETEKWCQAVLKAKDICGGTNVFMKKNILDEELISLRSLMRGAFVSCDILSGEEIVPHNVFYAFPCLSGQLTSGEIKKGLIATQNYSAFDPIIEPVITSEIHILREIVHEAKGMIMESGINLGDDIEFELSHHYGKSVFRQWGAVIITVLNRHYCKKLILVLPGQKHPMHYHKIKEESFQILSGCIKIDLNGKEQLMKPGEIVTVHPGEKHAFSSENGAIFEEISTMHIINDSYYEDELINSSDLMERKTILKSW